MKYWLITDTHFNHKEKMQQYCGRPEDYEEQILKGLLQIPEGDTLIHLGDICIGKNLETHEKYIKPLNCKKILVRGNHDPKSDNWYLNHGWDFVCRRFEIVRFKKRIMFSHKPQADDGVFDFNIHGHFHNSTHREPEFEEIYGEKHKLLAIEETNYRPVLLDKFINL